MPYVVVIHDSPEQIINVGHRLGFEGPRYSTRAKAEAALDAEMRRVTVDRLPVVGHVVEVDARDRVRQCWHWVPGNRARNPAQDSSIARIAETAVNFIRFSGSEPPGGFLIYEYSPDHVTVESKRSLSRQPSWLIEIFNRDGGWIVSIHLAVFRIGSLAGQGKATGGASALADAMDIAVKAFMSDKKDPQRPKDPFPDVRISFDSDAAMAALSRLERSTKTPDEIRAQSRDQRHQPKQTKLLDVEQKSGQMRLFNPKDRLSDEDLGEMLEILRGTKIKWNTPEWSNVASDSARRAVSSVKVGDLVRELYTPIGASFAFVVSRTPTSVTVLGWRDGYEPGGTRVQPRKSDYGRRVYKLDSHGFFTRSAGGRGMQLSFTDNDTARRLRYEPPSATKLVPARKAPSRAPKGATPRIIEAEGKGGQGRLFNPRLSSSVVDVGGRVVIDAWEDKVAFDSLLSRLKSAQSGDVWLSLTPGTIVWLNGKDALRPNPIANWKLIPAVVIKVDSSSVKVATCPLGRSAPKGLEITYKHRSIQGWRSTGRSLEENVIPYTTSFGTLYIDPDQRLISPRSTERIEYRYKSDRLFNPARSNQGFDESVVTDAVNLFRDVYGKKPAVIENRMVGRDEKGPELTLNGIKTIKQKDGVYDIKIGFKLSIAPRYGLVLFKPFDGLKLVERTQRSPSPILEADWTASAMSAITEQRRMIEREKRVVLETRARDRAAVEAKRVAKSELQSRQLRLFNPALKPGSKFRASANTPATGLKNGRPFGETNLIAGESYIVESIKGASAVVKQDTYPDMPWRASVPLTALAGVQAMSGRRREVMQKENR